MNSLVVLAAVMSVGMAQHWGGHPSAWAGNNAPGLPQDTPEVAAAKAAHLAALAKVNQNNGGAWAGQWDNDDGQWHGDQAGNWNNGANNAQQWNGAAQWQTYGHGGRWNGPLALPPGFDNNGAPLPVQDTAEVAAEKAKHFALYNGGNTAGPYNGAWNNGNNGAWNNGNNGAWNGNNGAWNGNNNNHGRWRRHAILAASPLVASPLIASPVLTSHAIATPLIRSHIAAPIITHSAIASPILTHSAFAAPLIRTHSLAHW